MSRETSPKKPSKRLKGISGAAHLSAGKVVRSPKGGISASSNFTERATGSYRRLMRRRSDAPTLHSPALRPRQQTPSSLAVAPGRSGAQLDIVGYRRDLLQEVENKIVSVVIRRVREGTITVAPSELAQRMLAVVPVSVPRNAMADQVGPTFYDTTGVTVLLAPPGANPISKQAVEQRRKRGTVLALKTSDKKWIYPTWQFVDHEVLPGLSEVLLVFGEAPAWSVATWLTTPASDLEGASPADWLREGRDRGSVLRAAQRMAARWAA